MSVNLTRRAMLTIGAGFGALALSGFRAGAASLPSTLRVGLSNQLPYAFLDEKGVLTGQSPDVLRAALKGSGIQDFQATVAEFGALIPGLIAKRFDVICTGLFIRPPRCQLIAYGNPDSMSRESMVVKTGNPDGIKSFDDLKGKQIGAIAGSAADEYLRKIGADVVPFQTDAEQFSAVSTGRVSAIVDDDTKISQFLGSTKDGAMELLKGIAVPQELIFTYGYGYVRPGLRKEDCSLRAAISQGLSEARGNGNVLALLKKYGFSEANLFFFPLK